MLETLWVDHYRPKNLSELTYHSEITQILKQLASTEDFPHLIFCGPTGAGKKTRAISFIKQFYHASTIVLNEEERILKPEGTSKTIQYTVLSSPYHIEITPADNEHDDKHIVQNVIKEIATQKSSSKNQKSFKLLIINQADKLTKEAQGALRRTMEKYVMRCRMILMCDNLHKLIMPIRSRCINIRVPAPSKDQIGNILYEISKDQSLKIDKQTIIKIVNSSGRNLRDAICQLEAFKCSKNPEKIMHPYKQEIKEIIKLIYKEQSPNMIMTIRNKFYDLLVNCVEGNLILKELILEIIHTNRLKPENIANLINKATQLETTMAQGTKTIVHLECFVAHAMQAVLKEK